MPHDSEALAFCLVVVPLGCCERARKEPHWFIRTVRLCLKENRAQLAVTCVRLDRDVSITARKCEYQRAY